MANGTKSFGILFVNLFTSHFKGLGLESPSHLISHEKKIQSEILGLLIEAFKEDKKKC